MNKNATKQDKKECAVYEDGYSLLVPTIAFSVLVWLLRFVTRGMSVPVFVLPP